LVNRNEFISSKLGVDSKIKKVDGLIFSVWGQARFIARRNLSGNGFFTNKTKNKGVFFTELTALLSEGTKEFGLGHNRVRKRGEGD